MVEGYLLVESNVKELDISLCTHHKAWNATGRYAMPQTVFSTKSLTTLNFGECKNKGQEHEFHKSSIYIFENYAPRIRAFARSHEINLGVLASVCPLLHVVYGVTLNFRARAPNPWRLLGVSHSIPFYMLWKRQD